MFILPTQHCTVQCNTLPHLGAANDPIAQLLDMQSYITDKPIHHLDITAEHLTLKSSGAMTNATAQGSCKGGLSKLNTSCDNSTVLSTGALH